DDAGRVVDFHGLRHSYVSGLVSGGVSVKVAQELARHSTPNLTIGRYSHVRLHDLTGALEGLPPTPGSPEPADAPQTNVVEPPAAGTDDRRPLPVGDPRRLKTGPSESPHVAPHPADFPGLSLTLAGTERAGETGPAKASNGSAGPLKNR